MRVRLIAESGEAIPPVCDFSADGQEVVRLGRNSKSTVVLQDRHASRQHAEIVRQDGHWFLRDCGTTNGTHLNGVRITQATLLENGQQIRIGDTCFRFRLEATDDSTAELPALAASDLNGEPPPEAEPQPDPLIVEAPVAEPPTVLQHDELTAVFVFMDGSLRETTTRGLVGLALHTIQQQTAATVCGFLSLDEDDPLPKMVLPDPVHVNTHLSRQLTLRVQGNGKTVWLAADESAAAEEGRNDSVLSYRDALCVPVPGGKTPQGALHVYKSGKLFSHREVRFCEVLAGYLGKSLSVLCTRRALEADNSRLRIHASGSDHDLIGDSPPMRQLHQQIRRLAEQPKIVLISGESGAGKELVALALHRLSSRREGPLVAVNCAAIAASMPEAELFGHCKGSFTGADRDRPGYFQQADMGTLFFDEIGELSENCQAKLLRVLESGSFRPVGAKGELKADVRILAATNRDLKRECLESNFRKDLFFRLGVEIRVPPLRERRSDIPALVEHFLARLAIEYKRSVRLSAAALKRLQEYHWPGNVRQLRSVLEHAVAMSENAIVDADELHLFSDGPVQTPDAFTMSLNLEELETWAIRQALRRAQGTITQAARLLGIHRDTLMLKMKKKGIDRSGGGKD